VLLPVLASEPLKLMRNEGARPASHSQEKTHRDVKCIAVEEKDLVVQGNDVFWTDISSGLESFFETGDTGSPGTAYREGRIERAARRALLL